MPSLLGLPLELIENIIDAICLTDDWTPTLAALNRTCKLFRELTTRHLYQWPETSHRWLLTRTLIACPHLAQFVTQLTDLCDSDDGNGTIPPEVEAYYHRVIDEGNAASKTEASQGESAKLYGIEDGTPRYDFEELDWYTVPPNDVVSGLCPNLEILHCDEYTSGTPYFWTPNSMMKLKELSFHVHFHDANWGFSLDKVEALLLAAPNIEMLNFHGCCSVHEVDFTMQRVKSINMSFSCFDAEDLSNIFRLCPNVEKLTFASAGALLHKTGENFTLREAKEVVLAHGKKLKNFSLDLQVASYDMNEQDVRNAEQEFAGRGIVFTCRL